MEKAVTWVREHQYITALCLPRKQLTNGVLIHYVTYIFFSNPVLAQIPSETLVQDKRAFTWRKKKVYNIGMLLIKYLHFHAQIKLKTSTKNPKQQTNKPSRYFLWGKVFHMKKHRQMTFRTYTTCQRNNNNNEKAHEWFHCSLTGTL